MLTTMQKRTILEREAARNLRKAKAADEKFAETHSPYSKTAAETRRFLAETCFREASLLVRQDDFSFILISALRYALPRRSCASFVVTEYIRSVLSHLSVKDLKVMLDDLEEAKRDSGKDGPLPYAMGDPHIDRPHWLRFLEDVRQEYMKKAAAQEGGTQV